MRELRIPHDVATPHRPQTNGVAERAVKRAIEGTKTLLLASGMGHEWWREAGQCFACLHNFTTPGPDGLTPYEQRRGESFTGYPVPFGAAVWYKPQGPHKERRSLATVSDAASSWGITSTAARNCLATT